MTTVGVIFKKEDDLIAGTATQVIKELKKKGYKVSLDGAKFVITLGGDGTILRAARMLAKKGLPILGVHMGGLGFMSEVELHKLDQALDQIAEKKYVLDQRIMIEAHAAGKTLLALNDLVICKSGIARVIKLEIDGIAKYTADGIIVSTATGSTAYNLSAGGPLLNPEAKSMIVTSICPHTINHRPLVLDRKIDIVLTRGGETILTADGQQVLYLKVGQKISIQKSKLITRFIRLGKYDFFGRVRAAFGFGPEA